MVSVSPELRDSLDYEEPDAIDPSFTLEFRSISLDSSGYEDLEFLDDQRPFSAHTDPSASRRKRRQRRSDATFDPLTPYRFRTIADGELFRLAVVLPGTGTAPVDCRLIWESSKKPKYDYRCLSYCWETIEREADIVCDGYRFPVTKNLLRALQNLRKPTTNLLIWIDQICINQDDDNERGHQVSIMKNIFHKAKEVIVWLGEEDDNSQKLCEYAKKMRRGDEGPKIKGILKRILSNRQLHDAIQSLLQRPWFQRVWVIPEVALAQFTVVACGRSRISWDNLVRLIRDVQPQTSGFDKQMGLLGNPRQRIAIITQMIASQKEGLAHTDITQLLLLAKGSKATDVRDMVYAFYGLTLLTTFPDYKRSIERLYADLIHMYVNSIKWETYYSSWHDLTEDQRTFQLMSILYSAGALHQHYSLPSWIPDWTFSWHLAPLWCKSTSNVVTNSGKDEWSMGIRSKFRAGGERRETFEVIDGAYGMHHLRVSVIIFDAIVVTSEMTPASTPGVDEPEAIESGSVESSSIRYGRTFFRTEKELVGLATPGVDIGDEIAAVLGGDVPVVLRPCETPDEQGKAYKLLCECFVQNDAIMFGELARTDWTLAEDIVLI